MDSKMNPVFLYPQPPQEAVRLIIDAAVIREHPLVSGRAFYVDKAKSVEFLSIINIPEDNARAIMELFPHVKYLLLEGIYFSDKNLRGYPVAVENLQLIGCKFREVVIEDWFDALSPTLQAIRFVDTKCGKDFSYELAPSRAVYRLKNLRAVEVEDSRDGGLGQICDTIEFLSYKCPRWTLDLDHLISKAPVKTLVLWALNKYHYEEVCNLPHLQHLRIVMSVDRKIKSCLEAKGLKTLDVHCTEPPKAQDQILILNDDCLERIFRFLELEDWIALGQAHGRFNNLLCEFIYPREELCFDDVDLDRYPEKEVKSILKGIGAHAKILWFNEWLQEESALPFFGKLEVLLTADDRLSGRDRQMIPAGLKKLSICGKEKWNSYASEFSDYEDEYDESFSEEEWESGDEEPVKFTVRELFRKLNPSLTSLELKDDFEAEDLKEITQLRELKLTAYRQYSIRELLQRNQARLEVLKIDHFNCAGRSPKWYVPYDTYEPAYDPPKHLHLCGLPALKVLHLTGLNRSVEISLDAFPLLEEIDISFNYETKPEIIGNILKGISTLINLKRVKVGSKLPHLNWVFPLKNVTQLEIQMQETDVMELLRKLPKLRKITSDFKRFPVDLENEITDYLVAENRSITLGNRYKTVVYP